VELFPPVPVKNRALIPGVFDVAVNVALVNFIRSVKIIYSLKKWEKISLKPLRFQNQRVI